MRSKKIEEAGSKFQINGGYECSKIQPKQEGV